MRKESGMFTFSTIPAGLRHTPVADQLECLNKVRHVSEPDYNAFTENFYLEQLQEDCFLWGGENL